MENWYHAIIAPSLEVTALRWLYCAKPLIYCTKELIYCRAPVADVPVGWGVPPGVHAGAVGAGEAESAAHATGSRRGRAGLQSRCGGTGDWDSGTMSSPQRERQKLCLLRRALFTSWGRCLSWFLVKRRYFTFEVEFIEDWIYYFLVFYNQTTTWCKYKWPCFSDLSCEPCGRLLC